MIVRSQNMHISIPREKIDRTEVQRKGDNVWIIVAVMSDDRAITLARYPSEEIAITVDVNMWISEAKMFVFPTSDMVVLS